VEDFFCRLALAAFQNNFLSKQVLDLLQLGVKVDARDRSDIV
jgi:hypothetical protein